MTPQELKYSILGDAFSGKLCENITSNDFGGIKTTELSEPPFDVPETWSWSTLGLCCEMYTGNSISETVKAAKYAGLKKGYDYIATKDVSFNQEICYDNGVRIPYDEGFKVARKNTVLMCIEGGSAGRKIGILDRDVCFGNKLCSFRVQNLDNKYLFYYLQSWLFKELFSGNMTGIIGGVSIKKLKEILIPIAPMDEQKRIVAKIEELLPLIDRYEQAWSKLEDFNKRFPGDMQKSILQMAIQGKLVPQRPEEGTGEELFQQIQTEKQALIKSGKIKKERQLSAISDDEIPFDIPDTWKWVRLNDLVSVLGDGIHGTPIFDETGTYYFVNGNNLVKGSIVFKADTKKVSASEYEKHKKPLDENTILISINGTIGNYAFYANEPIILGKSACYFSVLTGVNKEYIRHLLSTKWFMDYAVKEATQTTIKNVSLKAMRMFPVPLPPLAEQKRIVAKLEEILPLCERLK